MSTLKHKGKGPQAMTANELRDGFSVWLDENLDWTRDYAKSLRTEDQDLIDRMQLKAATDEAKNIVVGTYFIDVEPDTCLLYTSPSPRDATLSRMPSSA